MFEFATAGRVLVGAGRSAELPGLLAGHGTRVLACTGASPGRHAELLAGLGMPAAVFPVAGEPTVDLVRAAVAAAREHGADVVAAIGGGSVIDVGKAVARLLGTARQLSVSIPAEGLRPSPPSTTAAASTGIRLLQKFCRSGRS